MSTLILEPKSTKALFMKSLNGFTLKRDSTKMIDRLGSVFLIDLVTKYYLNLFRACEICDEKRAKNITPEDLQNALIDLECDNLVPALKSLMESESLKDEESEEETKNQNDISDSDNEAEKKIKEVAKHGDIISIKSKKTHKK